MEMASNENKLGALFSKPGVHEYKGTLYLGFSPPWLLAEVENFRFSPGDLLFATYPRSGTRLLSEILWLIHNDVNVAEARRVSDGLRVRFLEHAFDEFNPVEYYGATDPPRLIKTHLPSSFFQRAIEGSVVKVVVMVRDPRDVLVSLYRFYAADPGYVKYEGGWDGFFGIFEAKQLFGGDWFENTLGWLKYRDLENVLLVRYEQVRADPVTQVADVARFCGKELRSDQLRLIADYVTHEVPDDTRPGEWREVFSRDQTLRFQRLYDDYMGDVECYSLTP